MNNASSQPSAHVPATPLTVIMQAIAAGLDVPRIFNIVAQQAEHILAHDALVVLLRPDAREGEDARDANDAHELAVAFSDPPIMEARRSWPFSDFSFGPALLANQPVIVTDFAATADQYAGDMLLLEQAGRTGVIVPIAAAPHILGGLVVISGKPGLHGPEDVLLAEPIANLLAVALEHRRLDERARALAVVEERNRMAREIHDTLAQSLAGIIINLESLKPYKTRRSRLEADVLAETEILARGALEEARRSVLGLHPTPLEHQSLRDALTLELSALAKRAAVTTQFYVNGIERPLTPDLATALFRIAQEAFQNIYKHAAARHVILGLAFEERGVVLTVEDDGVGFVPSTTGITRATVPNNTGGFGLLSMEARARIVGGELLVTSHPGHGTAVRTSIPYLRSGITMGAVIPLEPDTRSPALQEPSPQLPPDNHVIRVLLVDDHSIVRQGIRHILEGQPNIEVVGEAEDGLAAVEEAARLHPDVVLLDLQMPGLSGIEALPRLRVVHPPVEVIILTVFDQNEEVFAALKVGARGYLLKDATPATVIAAVRAANRGQSSLAPALATRVMDRFAVLAQREVDPDALTEREMEILDCIAQGMPYKQIGAQLNIATKTVQYHVRNILQKLHAGSRGEAVAVATERGLLNRE
jgi:DNA-binding NarL/FixJ family response regulator/signal transduction histidine kinase